MSVLEKCTTTGLLLPVQEVLKPQKDSKFVDRNFGVILDQNLSMRQFWQIFEPAEWNFSKWRGVDKWTTEQQFHKGTLTNWDQFQWPLQFHDDKRHQQIKKKSL